MHVHNYVYGVHIQMCNKFNKFPKMQVPVHVVGAEFQSCHKFKLSLKIHVHVIGAHTHRWHCFKNEFVNTWTGHGH